MTAFLVGVFLAGAFLATDFLGAAFLDPGLPGFSVPKGFGAIEL